MRVPSLLVIERIAASPLVDARELAKREVDSSAGVNETTAETLAPPMMNRRREGSPTLFKESAKCSYRLPAQGRRPGRRTHRALTKLVLSLEDHASLAIGDVHRNFHAEPQVNRPWGLPSHTHLLC